MPQEFDPHAYAAAEDVPAFDPHAYASEELPPVPPSEAESAMRGAAHGITFGFADELSAGVNAARDYAQAKLGQRGDIDFGDAYDTNLNAIRARDKKSQEENPISYGGGELAGTVISPVGKALAGGKSVAGVMARGAVGGGLSGAGESTAHPFDSPEGLEKFGGDILTGTSLGAGMAGGGKLLGGIINKFTPQELKQFARERMVKAATGQNLRAFKQMRMTGAADESGNALDAAGRVLGQADEAGAPVVGWFSNAEEILPRAKAKQEFFGKQIGGVAKAIDEAVPGAVDGKKISQQILDYATSLPETEQTKPVIEKLLREADNFERRGSLSFKDAQDLKSSFKFKPMDSSTHTFGQEASNELNGIMRREMDRTADQIASVAPPDSELQKLASKYRESKMRYQAYRNTAEGAEKRVAANLSNRTPSPTDYMMGGMGALSSMMHGGSGLKTAALGFAGAAANKVARTRGSAFAGHSADLLARGLEKVPESVGTVAGAMNQAMQSGALPMAGTQVITDAMTPPVSREQRLRELMLKRARDLGAQGYPVTLPP